MVQTQYRARNITTEAGNAGDSIAESSPADDQDQYVIRGGAAGKARLHVIAAALRPSTLSLLRKAGITPGTTCLDVGCGGGDVTFELARLVGPRGKAIGIDLDRTKLRLAQQDAERAHIANVEFHAGNVYALDAEAAYDLVYARFLLTHLHDPQAVVQRMARAAKPGGAIVVEDIDHSAIFGYPACPALDRYITLYNQVVRLKGGDPEIGPKLPDLLRQAGLHNLHLQVVQPTFMEGEAKHISPITLANIAPAVISAGLATQAEINALIAEMEDFVCSPLTITSFPRIFQVWAYRR